jgi:hypothetical protein
MLILWLAARQNNAVRFVIRDGAASKTRRKYWVKTMESSGLLTPKGIAASTDERHLFVCDTGHHKIRLAALPSRSALADVRRITEGVEMFALAGNGRKGWRDGAALEASFNAPAGICEHADGTILVADTGNHCIRQIQRAADGKLVVKTIAGGYAGLPLAGGSDSKAASTRHFGYRDGERSLFRSPSAVIAGPHGELLVADTMNNCIRGLVRPASTGSPWKVSTICGRVTPGYADGNCAVALFDQPVGLCWAARGNSSTFFVTDRGNACIRQVGRSFDGLGDCLSFSWVRTIEVGAVPRALGSARNQDLVPRSHPLGIVCVLEQSTERQEVPVPKLVVCDGGDNLIKLLPVEDVERQAFNVGKTERFGAPKVSEARSVSTTSQESTWSSPRDESIGSLSYVAKACP